MDTNVYRQVTGLCIGVGFLLAALLNIIFPHTVHGQELREPPNMEEVDGLHEVVVGDTMYLIAGYYHIDLDTLIAVNPQIDNPHWIYPKELLVIPDVNGVQEF
jgi:LysM domain